MEGLPPSRGAAIIRICPRGTCALDSLQSVGVRWSSPPSLELGSNRFDENFNPSGSLRSVYAHSQIWLRQTAFGIPSGFLRFDLKWPVCAVSGSLRSLVYDAHGCLRHRFATTETQRGFALFPHLIRFFFCAYSEHDDS